MIYIYLCIYTEASMSLSGVFSSPTISQASQKSPTQAADSLLRSELDMKLRIALEFLHRDNEFLIASELGDDILLDKYIKYVPTNNDLIKFLQYRVVLHNVKHYCNEKPYYSFLYE